MFLWSDYMKKPLFKILICLLILSMLSSCDTTKVLKTKSITTELTQERVITKSNILQQEDYASFFNNFISSFTVPGLFEGIIPQGICYDEINGDFLITGYFEDAEYPSMIICVDGESGELLSYHTLKNTEGKDFFGHVGGIAISQNTVYVVNSGECYTLPLTDIDGSKNAPLQFKGKFKLILRLAVQLVVTYRKQSDLVLRTLLVCSKQLIDRYAEIIGDSGK